VFAGFFIAIMFVVVLYCPIATVKSDGIYDGINRADGMCI